MKLVFTDRVVNIQIEKLVEGDYLVTSTDLQGLVAQGRTISGTIEMARDVARKLIEAQENEKIVHSALLLQQKAISKIWDNPEEDIYET